MSYLLHGAPANLQDAVETIELALAGRFDEFESIVATGLSGAVPAGIIAYKHQKNLLLVRKQHEVSHGAELEGICTGRYIFIDDFVSTGATLNRLLAVAPRPDYVVLYRRPSHTWGGLTSVNPFGLHTYKAPA